MKKLTTFLSLLLIAVLVTAQVPHRMSYQSVIRDTDNNLVVNQEIGMQISILQGAADGTAVYVERHFPSTNANGLVSLEIGGGTEISGSFEEIDWGTDMYFIKTETDLQGGASYTIAGVSQVLSVPYALHAKTAETATEGLEETDPVFMASPAAGIEATHIDNWEEAYSWGDHEGLYHSIDWSPAWDDIEDKPDLADLAAVATSGSYDDLIDTPELNLADWNEAFSWGDHALADYLTEESDPLFVASPAADIEATHIDNWNAAFAWGDHAVEDYITDEIDPLFAASPAAGIEDTDIDRWNDAFDWGDTVEDHIDDWNEAHSWGDHADAGYITGEEDAVIHGLTVGRGSGAMETNTALGLEALVNNTTGEFNTAIGSYSLHFNTEGEGNTAHGPVTLYNNTTGELNTAVGIMALSFNTEGSDNTAIGGGALMLNYNGDQNTALGLEALRSNISNSKNTAIGYYAMRNANNTTSGEDTYNTAVGYSALIGSSDPANNTGFANTAIGGLSLESNQLGSFNTALGAAALGNNTEGHGNTATGLSTLLYNTTGEGNTAIGYIAGSAHTNISYGTFIGFAANAQFDNATNVTAIGYQAITTANNMVRIGNSSVTSIGGFAAWTNLSDERYKRNIETDVAGLEFIQKLRPVTYNLETNALSNHLGETNSLDEHGDLFANASAADIQARNEKMAIRYTGFVAQEVEAAAKAVGYDFSGVDAPQNKGGLYGLRYAEFVVPLVKAVQEQQEMIDKQEQMIQLLLNQVEELRSLLEE